MSRFCEIRYCIVRHVGFLVGEGRPAGDARAQPQTIDEVIALPSRPAPDAEALNGSLALLESIPSPVAIPDPEAQLEGALFDALTIMFVDPRGAQRARLAIAHATGEPTFEVLTAFLAFIRTAHYWTETHPALGGGSRRPSEPRSLRLVSSNWSIACSALTAHSAGSGPERCRS